MSEDWGDSPSTTNFSQGGFGRGRGRNASSSGFSGFGSREPGFSSESSNWRSRSTAQNSQCADNGEEMLDQIEVASAVVGRIIGKGGSKIRQIQDDSGARVDVPRDRDSDSLMVQLRGSESAVNKAKEMIIELTSDQGFSSDRSSQGFSTSGSGFQSQGFGSSEQQNGFGRGFGRSRDNSERGFGGAGSRDFGGDHSDECSGEIEVDSSLVGRIIGKGGSRIREIREESGARIDVPRDRSNPLVIQLSGSESAIQKAKEIINGIVNEQGMGFGDSGGNSESSQGFGSSGSGFQSQGFGSSEQQNGFGRGFGQGRDNSERSFGGAGGRGFGGSSDECTSEIEVDSSLVGRIIGKGGSKIKEIQDTSGARVEVPRDRDSDRLQVQIRGSGDAVQKARDLINEIIEEENSGFGGSRGHGGGRGGFGRNRGGFGGRNGHYNRYDDEDRVLDDQTLDAVSEQLAKVYSQGWSANETSEPIVIGEAPERPRINWGQVIGEADRKRKERWEGAHPIHKNFYTEDPDVANMDPVEVEHIRKENNSIMCVDLAKEQNRQIPNPILTFAHGFQHYPDIMSELKRAGFEYPSPIQKQGWPIALQGIDLIGIAQTGTGKTLAFLLPAFIHIEGQDVPRSKRLGPTVLVLSPTRELALQIESEVNKYSYKGIKCCCVYGGGNRREQVSIVKKGVEIVVATPGRLNDLVNAEILKLDSVSYLVLDEADRMLDMGFEPEIRKVLLDIRPDRHTIMTSATWPAGVRRLASSYMSDPIQVFVGSLDLAAVHSVRQQIEIIDEEDKRDRLREFLQYELGPEDKVIVFVGRKVICDDISSDFALNDIKCQSIHGDREQIDREQAIKDMKDGTSRILIATDVASRGLDICDITHVFNMDFPRNIEEYVHRVGRTGRAGRSGTAITLVTRKDWGNAKELIKILEEANQHVPEELYSMAERFTKMKERRDDDRRGGRFGGRGGGGGGFGSRGRRGRDFGGGFGMQLT